MLISGGKMNICKQTVSYLRRKQFRERLTGCFLIFLLLFQSGAAFSNAPEIIDVKAHSSNKPELAVLAIFRDEARFLKEWIEYYRLQGVDKFYLFNNLSEDNYKKVLKPYVDKKIVSLYQWNIESHNVGYWNHVQVTAYKHGMKAARSQGVNWLVVIDTDEFIVPLKHQTLLDLVRDYDNTDVGMLSALWIMFGTSNVAEIPKNELMIESLRNNGGRGLAIGEKSILHTLRADTNGPHYGTCLPGYRALRLPLELVQINHYWSRDEKYFYEIKIPRRMLWGWNQETSEGFMNKFNKTEFIDSCGFIQKYVPSLRKEMGLKQKTPIATKESL